MRGWSAWLGGARAGLVGAALLFGACGGEVHGADAGPDATECVGQADGTPCGTGMVCLSERCVAGSDRCGNGAIDPGEECDDGNDTAFDGCEPGICRTTCHADADCDDTSFCNGTEVCAPCATDDCAAGRSCASGAALDDGTECTLSAGGTGVCRASICVMSECGNGMVEPGESCDDGNTTLHDGCENDCRFTCEVDTTATQTWYLDCDGDGYSALDPDPRTQCLPPPADPCGGGWTLRLPAPGYIDCDDGNPDRHPGATELCNGIDDDCDDAHEAVGALDCDGAPGCETDSTSDADNCGACAHTCGTLNTDSVSCETSACAFTCTDPYRHCSTDDTSGCETNVGTDSDNCGSCGHSCLGGLCVSGNCQPIVVGGNPAVDMGLWSLYGLTVSGGELYGTDWYRTAGLIYHLPIGGNGDGSVTFSVKAPVTTDGSVGGYSDGSSLACSASPIINDGTGRILFGVFRQDSGGPAPGIWELRSDGTLLRNIVTLAAGQEIAGIAADANYVYYSEFWRFGGANQTGLFRVDRETGLNVMRFHDTHKIDSIFVEGGSVYWADQATNTIYAASPAALDSFVTLATTTNAPGVIQTDATYVYYQDGGVFHRVNKLGGTSDDITPPGGLIGGTVVNFLVDGTYVYYVAGSGAGNQRWYYFRKDMTSPAVRTLASISSNDTVSSVTQDATALYWTTYGGSGSAVPYSAIYRIAKPAP